MKLPNTQTDQLQANQLKDEMLNILLKMPVIVNAINEKEFKSEQEALKLRLELIDSITAIDEKIPTLQLEIKKLEEKADISFSKWDKDKSDLILHGQAVSELLRSRSALWKSLYKAGECEQSALNMRLHMIIISERQRLNSLEWEYSQVPKDVLGRIKNMIKPERVKNINSSIVVCNTRLKELEKIAIEVSALSMARLFPSKLKAKVNQLSEQVDDLTGLSRKTGGAQ